LLSIAAELTLHNDRSILQFENGAITSSIKLCSTHHTLLLPVTLPNIDRFSKFIDQLTQHSLTV